MSPLTDSPSRSTVYFFDSYEEAERNEGDGGSGFILGVKTTTAEMRFQVHLYVITARHVVGVRDRRFVRLVSPRKQPEIFPIAQNQWFFHAEDDIAVCPIGFTDSNYLVGTHCVPDHMILQPLGDWRTRLGLGDDVYMIGRLVRTGGRDGNITTARFGKLCAFPTFLIHNEHIDSDQESFLVEMYSTGGYSGAPVFVYRSDVDDFPNQSRLQIGSRGFRPMLLGVNWGHLQTLVYPTAEDRSTGDVLDLRMNTNTHIATVVPAWKIQELLSTEELKAMRVSAEEQETRERQSRRLKEEGAATTDSPQGDEPLLNREGFLTALRRASQSDNPEGQPGQGNSETTGEHPADG